MSQNSANSRFGTAWSAMACLHIVHAGWVQSRIASLHGRHTVCPQVIATGTPAPVPARSCLVNGSPQVGHASGSNDAGVLGSAASVGNRSRSLCALGTPLHTHIRTGTQYSSTQDGQRRRQGDLGAAEATQQRAVADTSRKLTMHPESVRLRARIPVVTQFPFRNGYGVSTVRLGARR